VRARSSSVPILLRSLILLQNRGSSTFHKIFDFLKCREQSAAFVPIYINFEMFYTYILQLVGHGTYYVGVAANLEKRLVRHNLGYVKSTRFKRPWIIYASTCFKTRGEARSFENRLKRIKKRKLLEDAVKHFKIC